jgi:hypothetical protein
MCRNSSLSMLFACDWLVYVENQFCVWEVSKSPFCSNCDFRCKITSSEYVVPCLVTSIYFDIRAMQRAHNAPVLGTPYIKVVLIVWGHEEIFPYEYRVAHILKTNIAVSYTKPTKWTILFLICLYYDTEYPVLYSNIDIQVTILRIFCFSVAMGYRHGTERTIQKISLWTYWPWMWQAYIECRLYNDEACILWKIIFHDWKYTNRKLKLLCGLSLMHKIPQLDRYFINGFFENMKQYLASEPKGIFPMSKSWTLISH